MGTEITTPSQPLSDLAPAIMEKVVVGGDLALLTPPQRLDYYLAVCRSLELNPATKPFEYILLPGRRGEQGKLILYATRACTDQLRAKHTISIEIMSREIREGVMEVRARATMPGGRCDESIGAVPLVKEDGKWVTGSDGKRRFEASGGTSPLSPEDRSNAMMKAETKAKRRVTLSIAGLGWLDESEIETIEGAKPIDGAETGAITLPRKIEAPPPPAPLPDVGAALAESLEKKAAEPSNGRISAEARKKLSAALDDFCELHGITEPEDRKKTTEEYAFKAYGRRTVKSTEEAEQVRAILLGDLIRLRQERELAERKAAHPDDPVPF